MILRSSSFVTAEVGPPSSGMRGLRAGRVWAGRSGAVRNFEPVDFELPAENPGKG